MNPVLRRELIERWRGRRAVLTLTLYLAVLGGILYLLYRVGQSVLQSQFGFGFGGVDSLSAGPVLGRFLVEGLLFFILLLVLFVAPGYAASAVSGERERRTLPLLQVTLLRPFEIVLGKLGASVAWLALLVTAALPLGAAAFFLGGIGLGDLLRGVAMILAVGVCVAAMSLGISSVVKRTSAAVVLTYGLVLALAGGTAFLSLAEVAVRASRGDDLRTPLALYLNPFFGVADAVRAQNPSGAGMSALPSPLGLMAEALPGAPAMRQRDDVIMEAQPALPEPAFTEPLPIAPLEDAGPVPPPPAEAPPAPPVPPAVAAPPPPGAGAVVIEEAPGPLGADAGADRALVWLRVLGLYVALGLLGLLTATRRVRTGRAVARPRPAPPVAPPAGGSAPAAAAAPQPGVVS